MVEAADALSSGLSISDITFINGTVYRTTSLEDVYDYKLLPTYGQMRENPRAYAASFYTQYRNTDAWTAKRLVEPYGEREFVVQNPPQMPLTTPEMDRIYSLPYERTYHPCYEAGRGNPGHFRGQVQPDILPRLLWRLQFLRADLPPGPDHSDPQPCLDPGGGGADDLGAGL